MNSSRLCEARGVLAAGQTFCAVIAAKRSRISGSLRIGHIAQESLLDWAEWDENSGAWVIPGSGAWIPHRILLTESIILKEELF